ncbi:M20/M25/M40 family metallo-hydrolase [Aequorivita lipolytica]|uniref:M20/M25/M40 family metallo-hydrolase n=1 Tax=Aequorivita lipolytica TaxID=153267 RepID=A0A5C6YR59_9FLAO|nr:M20/M25/M40 family metallo-hydrolase [Aequorivita lipolytica]TXD69933.1 M20/M25/M40 family metallo-hydrolase [Aequorivita lipolytica]SRX50243.1 Bacterial leucyl aminopeptidase [Aequorivita lipolytica]
MKKFTTGIFTFLLFTIAGLAQNGSNIYATMDATDAVSFKALYPEGITILASNEKQAAVLLSEEVTHSIHDNVKTHGPGYIFRASEAMALQALNREPRRNPQIDFSITEDIFVNECLDLVDGQNIENDILNLQGYGTRYHTKSQAEQAVIDQKAKWDAMITAAGRTDVSTRIYNHVNTPMPSVILTFEGANTPDEFVIIGGHIDSTTFGDKNNAPGADDNASGIASLNEMVRVLLEKNFVPNRSIEVMAFAAEEIGLVGSAEIAQEYADDGVNVAAYVQFDMTGYNGSNSDIYITTDWYNSSSLNNYLTDLMDHYNASGIHSFTYNYTECGYGCSDHASWADNGFDAAFPFEADFGEDNPNIHSPGDVYSFFGEPDHSVKFTKLGLQFLIEAAKPQTLSVDDFSENAIRVFVKDKTLNFRLNNTVSNVKEVAIYNVAGQRIISEEMNSEIGSVQLQQFAQGFYIAQFTLENGYSFTKKFILN